MIASDRIAHFAAPNDSLLDQIDSSSLSFLILADFGCFLSLGDLLLMPFGNENRLFELEEPFSDFSVLGSVNTHSKRMFRKIWFGGFVNCGRDNNLMSWRFVVLGRCTFRVGQRVRGRGFHFNICTKVRKFNWIFSCCSGWWQACRKWFETRISCIFTWRNEWDFGDCFGLFWSFTFFFHKRYHIIVVFLLIILSYRYWILQPNRGLHQEDIWRFERHRLRATRGLNYLIQYLNYFSFNT